MLRTLFRSLGNAVLVLWGVATVLFFLFDVLGDPARAMTAQRTDAETLENLRRELHLDAPAWQRYFFLLNDLSPISYYQSPAGSPAAAKGLWLGSEGDSPALVLKPPYLGRSFFNGEPVGHLYLSRLPATLVLAGLSLFFAALLGISAGVMAGRKPGSRFDRVSSFVAMLGISAPSFLVSVLLLWLLAVALGNFTGLPVAGYWIRQHPLTLEYTFAPRYLVLPVLSLAFRPTSILFQLTRDSVDNTQRQDFIRTALAKGLAQRQVLWKHNVRNAFPPVLTALSGWLAALLAGTFFIEFIFDWQGVGKLTIDALYQNDFPVVMGCALATGALFLLISMLTDATYALLDPRVRTSSD